MMNKKIIKWTREYKIKYMANWRKNNPERASYLYKKWKKENPDKVKEMKIKYYFKNQDKIKKYHSEYYLKNKEINKQKHKLWRESNKDKIKLINKEYWENNKEKVKVCFKNWKLRDRDNYLNSKKKYYKGIKNNSKYKLDRSMHGSIYSALKNKNYKSWHEMVDFTLEELKKHLEYNFKKGMNWENYGDWHIDHFIPKSWFIYNSPEDIGFKICWSLDNLQPMWRNENCSKGNRLLK